MDKPSSADWSSLAQCAARGDQGAFSLLYQSTVTEVYRTVYLLSHASIDVEEIVQEVYIGIWKSLGRYDATRPFSPWLHGLIIRQVRNARRSRWRRWRLLSGELELHREEPAPQPLGGLLTDHHMDLLSAIESLPLRLREIIILRYFHGYSLVEIGEILRIPSGTARSRHHEAVRRLRIDYEAPDGGEQPKCQPNEI